MIAPPEVVRKAPLIDWTIAAILSAVLFAVLNITDKIIMTGLGLRVRSFLLFIGFQTLLTLVVIAVLNPFPSMSAETLARGLGAGLLWGIGSPLILWSLSREDVSRITPISQSHPLLVVLLAVIVLGERLTVLQSFAVALAFGGALLAALRLWEDGGRIRLSSTVGYLIIGITFIAVGQTLLKTVTDDLSFWHAMALRSAGMAIVLIPMNLRWDIATELAIFARRGKAAFALTFDAGIATVALALITFAIATGPLSLTNAIVGTTPMIVFFASMLLAWKVPLLLDETVTRRVIAQKLVAAGMVVSGVVIIAVA